MSHCSVVSCRLLCQAANMAFYLLELKGALADLSSVWSPGSPVSSAVSTRACVAPSPQLAEAGTHAPSPRPTYSVSLKPISTTEAAPMCKHLRRAVLVQGYKRAPQPRRAESSYPRLLPNQIQLPLPRKVVQDCHTHTQMPCGLQPPPLRFWPEA